MNWRRVTKGENPAAHAAKRYTRAAPGKFRKSSKTISFRQHLQGERGGISIEKQIKQRRATPGYSNEAAKKSYQTRQRNKDLREYLHKAASLASGDAALINKYLKTGYDGLSSAEQKRFKHLFTAYPENLIRRWLGSDERPATTRRLWGRAA